MNINVILWGVALVLVVVYGRQAFNAIRLDWMMSKGGTWTYRLKLTWIHYRIHVPIRLMILGNRLYHIVYLMRVWRYNFNTRLGYNLKYPRYNQPFFRTKVRKD